MKGLHDIEPYLIESSESGLFGLRIKIFNIKYAVMNVYYHCDLKLPFMQNQIRKFFSKDGLNVLGGDFNWDLNESPLKSLQNPLNLGIYQDWSGQNQPISKDNVLIISLFPRML